MVASTDILPIAGSAGANVIDQATYASLATLLANGFSSGVVQSNVFNKVIRQSSFMAAGLAQWMVSQGISVPDDGNLTNLVVEINAALSAIIAASLGQYVHDTGTTNHLVVALTPPITTYVDGLNVRILIKNSITGASTLDAGGGAVALLRNDGNPTQAGDGPANSVISATYVASVSSFEISGLVPSQLGAYIKTVKSRQITASGTYTPSAGIVYALVRIIGGGAGGNGLGGGGAGEYAEGVFSASDIGVGTACTIGAGGGGGGNGGTTSFGSLMTAVGGNVGNQGVSNTNAFNSLGGLGGSGGTGGTFRSPGATGQGGGNARFNFILQWVGAGASSPWGGGGQGSVGAADVSHINATNATGFGSGGGGDNVGGAGGLGSPGVIQIMEFCSQ